MFAVFPSNPILIGSGRDANVYSSAPLNSSAVVYKKGDVTLAEYILGIAANVLCPRACPRVFDFFKHSDGDSVISQIYIVGKTADLLILGIPDIVSLLDTYYKLAIGGVFHNDLQATNCICDNDGNFHLIDFGIASTSMFPDDLSQHMCLMASLLLQSLLFPSSGKKTAFSSWCLSTPSLRTRYINHLIFGAVRWLRVQFNDNSLLVTVNVRDERVISWQLRSFFTGKNSGLIVSAAPPATPRRIPTRLARKNITFSNDGCNTVSEKCNKILF